MKILIAPLNWGLGHASRCLPLIVRHLKQGDEVVLGGDGEALTLMTKHFPGLRVVPLAPLALRYSSGTSQIGAMLMALPRLLRFIRQDRRMLERLLAQESFDLIISDNRFGLSCPGTRCVYITHQLLIRMPRGLRWLEGAAHRIHGHYIKRFDECLIPDREDGHNLSGDLSHYYPLPANARFIGPLSRFEYITPRPQDQHYDAVAVLSGLEPQRTLLEQQLISEYRNKQETILLIQGKLRRPMTTITRQNITIVPYMSDEAVAWHLQHAQTIISRSGYSSLMDYDVLGLLAPEHKQKLRLIPTPGQPEQEYLAAWINRP